MPLLAPIGLDGAFRDPATGLTEFRLLGAKLKPLSFAHARIMIDAELSPAPRDYAELVLLTILASTPPERLTRLCSRLQSGKMPWPVRLRGLRVTLALRWLHWRQGDAAVVSYVSAAMRRWRAYLAYWTAAPHWRCLGGPIQGAQQPGNADQLWCWLTGQRECAAEIDGNPSSKILHAAAAVFPSS